MKFKFRLAYYLFGLLLGVFFVVWFLGAKAEKRGVAFCYLPNCRVLQELRKKPLTISEEAQGILEEGWVDLNDVKLTLTYGDVDFSNSNKPFKNGKIYLIEGKNTKNQEITVKMINYTDKVTLETIEKK